MDEVQRLQFADLALVDGGLKAEVELILLTPKAGKLKNNTAAKNARLRHQSASASR